MRKLAGLLVLTLACAGSGRQPAPTRRVFDAGSSPETKRPKTFHARHYSLALSFDEEAGEVYGRESIEF